MLSVRPTPATEDITVIDPMTEKLLTPAQAARRFPSTREGRTMHPSAVIRLHKRDGLEMIRFGGRLFTSVEAIRRYVAALSSRPEDRAAAAIRTPATRRREADRARAVLEAAGFRAQKRPG
jgi:hypothetical protein